MGTGGASQQKGVLKPDEAPERARRPHRRSPKGKRHDVSDAYDDTEGNDQKRSAAAARSMTRLLLHVHGLRWMQVERWKGHSLIWRTTRPHLALIDRIHDVVTPVTRFARLQGRTMTPKSVQGHDPAGCYSTIDWVWEDLEMVASPALHFWEAWGRDVDRGRTKEQFLKGLTCTAWPRAASRHGASAPRRDCGWALSMQGPALASWAAGWVWEFCVCAPRFCSPVWRNGECGGA